MLTPSIVSTAAEMHLQVDKKLHAEPRLHLLGLLCPAPSWLDVYPAASLVCLCTPLPGMGVQACLEPPVGGCPRPGEGARATLGKYRLAGTGPLAKVACVYEGQMRVCWERSIADQSVSHPHFPQDH